MLEAATGLRLLLMQPGLDEPTSLGPWPHPGAACYKRDWHLESLGFSFNFGWRAGTHRESLLPKA
jgi:hypothetical protein